MVDGLLSCPRAECWQVLALYGVGTPLLFTATPGHLTASTCEALVTTSTCSHWANVFPTVCSLILGSHSSRPVAPVTWFLFSDHSPLFPLKRGWLKVEPKAALHSILSHYFLGTARPTCQFYSTLPEFVIYYVDLSVSQHRRVSGNRPLSCTLSHMYVQTPGVHMVHDFSVQLLGSQQSRMHG